MEDIPRALHPEHTHRHGLFLYQSSQNPDSGIIELYRSSASVHVPRAALQGLFSSLTNPAEGTILL
jgi:hypothetical protein